MFGGLDKKKMAQAQQISGKVQSLIRIDHKAKSILILFDTEDKEAADFIDNTLLTQLPATFAQQLGLFFAIKGEIIDVNKPK